MFYGVEKDKNLFETGRPNERNKFVDRILINCQISRAIKSGGILFDVFLFAQTWQAMLAPIVVFNCFQRYSLTDTLRFEFSMPVAFTCFGFKEEEV